MTWGHALQRGVGGRVTVRDSEGHGRHWHSNELWAAAVHIGAKQRSLPRVFTRMSDQHQQGPGDDGKRGGAVQQRSTARRAEGLLTRQWLVDGPAWPWGSQCLTHDCAPSASTTRPNIHTRIHIQRTPTAHTEDGKAPKRAERTGSNNGSGRRWSKHPRSPASSPRGQKAA